MKTIVKTKLEQRSALVRLSAFFALTMAMNATSAQAATLVCSVKIAAVGITPNGTIIPNMEGAGWPYICNLNTDYITSHGTVTPATCTGWLSMFMTASATQQNVTFYLDYGTQTAPADCGSIPNFSWQIPPVSPYIMTLSKN